MTSNMNNNNNFAFFSPFSIEKNLCEMCYLEKRKRLLWIVISTVTIDMAEVRVRLWSVSSCEFSVREGNKLLFVNFFLWFRFHQWARIIIELNNNNNNKKKSHFFTLFTLNLYLSFARTQQTTQESVRKLMFSS